MRVTKTHRKHLRALLHPDARLVIFGTRDHRNARGETWWLYPRGLAGADRRRLCGLTPAAIEHVCGTVKDYPWQVVSYVPQGVVLRLTDGGRGKLYLWLEPKPTVVWRRQA